MGIAEGIAIGIFVVTILLYFVFVYRKKNTYLEKPLPFRDHKRIAIADAKENQLVMVGGKVRYVGKPLRSPLSNTPCFYWNVVVRRWDYSDNSEMEVVYDSEMQSFAIEDGTGRAYIHQMTLPEGLVPPPEEEFAMPPDKQSIIDFMANHQQFVSGTEWDLRYYEIVMREGEEIAALGIANWEADPEPAGASSDGSGYRQAPKRLALKPDQEGKLYVSNHALVLEE